jgi:hypothetical protein
MKTILTSAAVLLTLTSARSQPIVGTNPMPSSQAHIAILPDAPRPLDLDGGQSSPPAVDSKQSQTLPPQTKRIL